MVGDGSEDFLGGAEGGVVELGRQQVVAPLRGGQGLHRQLGEARALRVEHRRAVLGTSRLSSCIRGIAAQGLLLGLLPVLIAPLLSVHAVSLALGTVIVLLVRMKEA